MTGLALHAHRATMRFHDSLGDVEAQASARAGRLLCLPIPLEDAVQLFACDACSLVDDTKLVAIVMHCSADAHARSRRRELDRISNEVRQHLKDALGIHVDLRIPRWLGNEFDSLGLGNGD